MFRCKTLTNAYVPLIIFDKDQDYIIIHLNHKKETSILYAKMMNISFLFLLHSLNLISLPVSRVLYSLIEAVMIICLVLPLPTGSSDLPEACRAGLALLFGLASGWSLHVPSLLPGKRWALTPPFHPYRNIRRYISVALVLGSPPPGVTRHPALGSPDFPHLRPFGTCSRDHPADLPKTFYHKHPGLYNIIFY